MKTKDFRDRYPQEFYYGVFCIIDLAKGYNIMDEHEANDVAWMKGVELYEDFFNSKHNVDDYSEIDCMNNYLLQDIKKKKVIVWKDRTATYWDNGEIVTTELWELK